MSVRPEVLLLILLCALVTFVPRVLPMVFAHRLRLHVRVIAWLRLLPPAVLAALLVPLIFLNNEDQLLWDGLFIRLAAATVAFSVAILSRNIILTLLIGMGTFALFSRMAG